MCPCVQESFTGGRSLLRGGGGGHRFNAPAAPPPVSAQSVDAQRAHLERVLGATTTVLFVASLSYVALSTLYGCIREGSRRRRARRASGADEGDSAGVAPACQEITKLALEKIPVHVHVHVVVVQARDGNGAGAEVEEEEPDCCAVCLAEYAAGDEVRVLPACRHRFHRECVDRWLLTRVPTCPVCRAPVGPVEEPDAKEDCATVHVGVDAAGSRVLPAMSP